MRRGADQRGRRRGVGERGLAGDGPCLRVVGLRLGVEVQGGHVGCGRGGFRGPAAAVGGGRSLEVRDLNGNYSDPSNWQVSAALGGSPGYQAILPFIETIGFTSGDVQLSFRAEPGLTYEVYANDGLQSESWVLMKVISPQPVSRTELVRETAGPRARFYRIKSF